jgi:hypothetical protein
MKMSLVRRVFGTSRVRVLAQLPPPLESMRQYSLVTSFFIKNPNYETGHFCKKAIRAHLPERAFLSLPESPCPLERVAVPSRPSARARTSGCCRAEKSFSPSFLSSTL